MTERSEDMPSERPDSWVATLRHIAKEGRVFVVATNCCLRASDIPADVPDRDALYAPDEDWIAQGNTTIVGPDGEIIAGPLIGSEGILYAEVDATVAHRSRREFDPVGHYARPDVFRLVVDTRPHRPVEFTTVGPDRAPSTPPPDQPMREET